MEPTATGEDEVLRRFLAACADAMIGSGESVDVITEKITTIAGRYDAQDAVVMILPTVSVVQLGNVAHARPSYAADSAGDLRFDQIAALYRLLQEAEQHLVDPADGLRRLEQIKAMRPRFGPVLRVLGHALLTTALCLMLVPTWPGAAIAFGLGVLFGLAKLVRFPPLQLVFPVLSAFVCALAVLPLATRVPVGDPLRLVIAVLATFLPGAMLTTATVELAAGQIVSGASRLVAGIVQLGLLATGILAARAVLGTGHLEFAGGAVLLPGWVGPLAVLLFAASVYLHFSAPAGSSGWILLAVLVAYGGQQLGTLIFGPGLSGFFGALLMTPVVLVIAALPHGAPSQLTFLPAFWLLAPGAVSLVSLTETATGTGRSSDAVLAVAAVLSVALGVLIGTAVFRIGRASAQALRPARPR